MIKIIHAKNIMTLFKTQVGGGLTLHIILRYIMPAIIKCNKHCDIYIPYVLLDQYQLQYDTHYIYAYNPSNLT